MTMSLPEESRTTFRLRILTMPSMVRLDERLVEHLRRAADVEGAHGELGARLADRLRRDDAHRLAHVDRRAAREIAAVALGADAELGLAGQHRADADFWTPAFSISSTCALEDLVAARQRSPRR